MPVQYKRLDPKSDVKTQIAPSVNSLLSVTSQALATSYNVSAYTIGPISGSYVYTPDIFGSSTAGISPSGAINTLSFVYFNRWSSQYFNAASGIYTLPASHTANTNVLYGRMIEVLQPTRSHGIWPDTCTAVFTYNSTSFTAVDSARDSFGTNKESLIFGKLTDINDPTHVLGSIFYDDGVILMHGGTGAASSFTQASVTGIAWRGSITGALTSSVSATHIIIESLKFKTYDMLVRNIYFCHLKADEFNFTSNPSAQGNEFLQDSRNSTVYISKVGLVDERKRTVAIAAVTPPFKKNQYTVHTFRVVVSV